ncbi:hypothetical protein DAEQUDRAFT_674700 [Daedalea quercina L-15889]|uniref:Uncharacterized protein n=1 Tax=Daedalea quercina L-15889 TaxID=1314783 RepID=A0A165N762_9APHY|nr:hypothetical protein DAEQUDRAFT_674700 [Daedalea quercina L-15889]
MSSDPSSKADNPPRASGKDAEAKHSGYAPIFGLSDGKRDSLPRWLPISLVRQRAAAGLQKSLGGSAPPPPRKNGGSGTSPPPPPRRSVFTSSTSPPPPRFSSSSQTPLPRVSVKTGPVDRSAIPPVTSSPSVATTAADDNFNGALYSAKAFGIATLLVGAGAVTTVWGVQQALGVENTQEFAHRMRSFILRRMSFLSSRIHRPPDPEDGGNDSGTPRLHVNQTAGTVGWSWPDAEQRLKAAYEEGGIMGWAEAAIRELEAEGEFERSKRGHA